MTAFLRFLSQMAWQIGHSLAAELFHDLLELFVEDLHHLIASLGAHCADPVHRGAAQEGEFRPAGEGDGDIGPGTDAAIHHDLGASLELLGEFGRGFDGR